VAPDASREAARYRRRHADARWQQTVLGLFVSAKPSGVTMTPLPAPAGFFTSMATTDGDTRPTAFVTAWE